MATSGRAVPAKRKADDDQPEPENRPGKIRNSLPRELRQLIDDYTFVERVVMHRDRVHGSVKSVKLVAAAPNRIRAQAMAKAAAAQLQERRAAAEQPKVKVKAKAKPKVRPRLTPKSRGDPATRTHLQQVKLGGEEFHVGDTVYVVLDERFLAAGHASLHDELFGCDMCGKKDKDGTSLLECNRCLGGFHLRCLSPPLAQVPEGEWVCPSCAAGRPPRRQPPSSLREHFLQQRGLSMARIESIWHDAGETELKFCARWYFLPEESHAGRQPHHAAREVFLSQLRDEASVHSIVQKTGVQTPADYYRNAPAPEGVAGDDDVYLCEYEYDCVWQRFRRRTEWESDSEEEGEAWWHAGRGAGSDDEGGDVTFKPVHATMDERRPRRGKQAAGGKKSRVLDDVLDTVGAMSIPEHVRRPAAASALGSARDALTLAAVPRSLPCREAERTTVERFVEEVLADAETEAGKCLYVSGIPGTGKTATVLDVMRSLRRRSEAGDLPQFQFVEINGLRLPGPQFAYSCLYEALTGERLGPAAAAAALEEVFAGSGKGARRGSAISRRPIVVLLDEMDLLVTRTQTVLYNMFDWPARRGSRLSIIGIANTMDLPERLHPRIGSRLAGRRVVFQPYQRDQLETIVRSRLEGCSAFDANALTLVARKVANCSGDVRRCLELCRRAAELVQEQEAGAAGTSGQAASGRVTIRHVDAAIREAFNTSHVKLMQESCRLERLLLGAVHLEARFTGRAEAALEAVADRLRQLCAANGEPQYPIGALLECAVALGSKRLLICDPGHKRLKAKVALNVPVNDLVHVLAHDRDLGWMAARLGQ